MQSVQQARDILVIDDERADVVLVAMGLQKSELQVAVRGISSCEEVLYAIESSDFQVPDLILLDLNMPGMDGKEILRHLKAHERWRRTPVVVFSGSDLPSDVGDCYALHANAYVTKPNDLSGYRAVLKDICDFWFSTAALWKRGLRPAGAL